MKGPVPLALSEAKLGVVADTGVGATALFASAHFLSMMYQVSHCEMQDGIGRGQHEIDGVVVDLDDLGIGGNAGLQVGAGGADAVGGEHDIVGGEASPLWNLTFLRRWKRHRVGSGVSQLSASAGNDLEVLVARDQTFIDMAEMGMRGGFVECVGIERLRSPWLA